MVYITVGIPGSGKSTFVENAVKDAAEKGRTITVVCPDDIREELTGNAADQRKNAEVWAMAYARAKAAIRSGVDVIFDSTAVSKKARANIVRALGIDSATAVYFDTPFPECQRRNAMRTRQVPEFVLQRMQASFEKPDTTKEPYLCAAERGLA